MVPALRRGPGQLERTVPAKRTLAGETMSVKSASKGVEFAGLRQTRGKGWPLIASLATGGMLRYCETLIEVCTSCFPFFGFSMISTTRCVPGLEKHGCKFTITILQLHEQNSRKVSLVKSAVYSKKALALRNGRTLSTLPAVWFQQFGECSGDRI